MNFDNYKSLIFDCDWVILNSNKIKTDGFKYVSQSYGKNLSDELINFHIKNGGVSRYEKFEYFIDKILEVKENKNSRELLLKKFLSEYSYFTEKNLLNSEIAYGIKDLRKKTLGIKWHIISGGDQRQLNYIFKKKGIYNLFDGGIFGSPDNKYKISEREIKNGNILFPAIFLGDSKLDHEVSKANRFDFIFVSDWTEFKEYKKYCIANHLKSISKIYDLVNF